MISQISSATLSHSPHLSTGDREVGKDAVFLVFVASVRLQAFTFTVVPQLQGAASRINVRCKQSKCEM